MKFKVQINDQQQPLEATRQGNQIVLVHEGREIVMNVLHQDGPTWVVELVHEDGTRPQLRIALHPNGQQRTLWLNGQTVTYERLREEGDKKDDKPAGSLTATIPAIVAQILVQVGDTVQASDKLILLESMKMVIPIQAPHDGVVQAIHCAVGDAVQPGVPLLTVEAPSS